jgi:hypothetical protein
VLSEKIVAANHTTAFQNPEAITEMKRILRLYLKKTAQCPLKSALRIALRLATEKVHSYCVKQANLVLR